MKLDRRKFLENITQWTGGLSLSLLPTALDRKLFDDLLLAEKDELANSEQFWQQIREAYSISDRLINLNNGGVSPHPTVVRKALERYHDLANQGPSHFMWKVLDKQREPLRQKLAGLLGAENDEVAIHRNASEALETVIFGLQLNAGDEVILAKQDYPNMIHAWNQRALRDKIILKWVDLDLPSEDVDYFVNKYQQEITKKTRVIHLTHVINWNGQITPVKAITKMAHANGLDVILDAAHSFAQFYFDIKDLGCDYMGTSLHKWLGAPFGTGMLYVSKNKIAEIYSLFGSPEPLSSNIRKFEHLGTRSFAVEQAIGHAIDFHLLLGWERKYSRLYYLKNYWIDKLSSKIDIDLKTSKNRDFGGAIGLFSLRAKPDMALYQYLNRQRIHTSPSKWNGIAGIRVSPNVYTTLTELDEFVEAVIRFDSGKV